MRENTENYITFAGLIGKKVTRIDKNGEEITKNISYILQFMIAQDLWQAYNQILSITFLKEFIELNVNIDTVMKNMKHLELRMSKSTFFLNT